MSELIDRQAALDIFDDYNISVENGELEAYSRDRKRMCELPPAQPEPQWIPISDRLPRDGSWNIFTDGKNISVERYKADAIDHFFPNGRWFQLEDVIAWMPLPEHYKPNK